MAKASVFVHQWITSMPTLAWPLSLGATFAALFWLVDSVLWRARPFKPLFGIPDLNGTWEATGISMLS
jgi:hypothetical protein